jgi:hypothetical protein
MATRGKGTATVGYNVQIAVDTEHHLIVAHEVINQGYDRHQLAPMALKAQQATGCEQVIALADRGYFSSDQVLLCEGTGVAPIVPKTLTSSGAKRGFFTRQDFIYDAEHDHYTCPAGAKLTKANRRADHTEDFDFYRHLSACFTCPLRSRCTPTKLRHIKRWENEDVLDRMQARLDRMPEAMGVRRQTVEHPFGTLKAWMGATHLLTRTLDKVRTEMSLHVLAYNLKRMIRIFGVGPLMAAIRTCRLALQTRQPIYRRLDRHGRQIQRIAHLLSRVFPRPRPLADLRWWVSNVGSGHSRVLAGNRHADCLKDEE